MDLAVYGVVETALGQHRFTVPDPLGLHSTDAQVACLCELVERAEGVIQEDRCRIAVRSDLEMWSRGETLK
eukprot:5409116-Amphidinium_carterae.1